MSIAATVDGTTYSDVQTISVGGKSVALNQVGLPSASGEFTLVNTTYTYTINHNLGYSSVFVIAQRVNSDGSVVESDYRYHAILFVGWTKQINGVDIYNTSQEYQYTSEGAPAKITLDPSNDSYLGGLRMYFPAVSTNGILDTFGYCARSINGLLDPTLNSVTMCPQYQLFPGRWVWKAYALGD